MEQFPQLQTFLTHCWNERVISEQREVAASLVIASWGSQPSTGKDT